MTTKKYLVPAILMILVAMLLATSSSASPSQQTGGPVTTATHEETGALSYLAADPNNPIIIAGATGQGISAGDRAMAVLNIYGPQFGLNNPNQELSTKDVSVPEKGRTVTHYQQVYNGVPVMAGELMINMTSGGGLLSINGEISPNLNVKTTPSISSGDAQTTALAVVAKAYGMSASDFTASSPELWIYDARLLVPSERPAELVWRMEVAHNNPGVPIFELVLVNAHDGGVPLHFNQTDNIVGEIYAYQDEDPTPTPTPTSEETTESSDPTPTETDVVEEPTPTETAEAPTATPTPITSPTPTLEATPTPTLEASPTPTVEASPTQETDANPSPTPRAESETDGEAREPHYGFGSGTVYYVKTSGDGGNDSNDCLSAGAACATVGGALGKATNDDTIRVAIGTYVENLTISINIQILGGWDTSFVSQSGFSTIDGNAANHVMLIYNDTVELDHLIIQNGLKSSGNERGGGINSSGTVTLMNSVVQDNVAHFDGGGIFSSNSLTIIDSAIINNHANSTAGAIIFTGGTNVIRNTTISGNTSDGNTGGIFNASNLTLNNVTLAGNTASGGSSEGGGMVSGGGGTVTMSNTIIADNSAVNGPDCWTSVSITSTYNLVENTSGCTLSGGTGDVTGSDPQLVALSGTPATHAIPTTSPAIDAGSSATPGSGGTSCEATDQRGAPRPFDGDGTGGSRCDVGAYEATVGISADSGTPQSAQVSTQFAQSLVVLVYDTGGNPISGETVTFTAPASGASGTFSDTTTNVTTATTSASGVAISAYFTANATAGSYTVAATSPSTAGQADFALTNVDSFLGEIDTYTANNLTTLPGTLLCNETQPNCTNGSDQHADFAHFYANDTYEFYFSHFGRDSIDGAGMTIVSSVHYDANYVNAFWSGSGQQMVYGDGAGFSLADDVVGHELTHGVTRNESDLFYYYQSGAINEALSDIFGEFVDQTNGKGDDSAGVKWLQGEDVTGFGALRDMQDPTTFGDPDKVSSANYYTTEGDLFHGNHDNGGVHINSGVVNKAAYLLTDGDTFNSYTVTGLGIDKVAAIFYEVNTNLLVSGSDFKDLYYLLPQACTNLIGGGEGITAGDCTEVQDAVDAVELDHDPTGSFMPEAEVCTTGYSPLDLFFDDFESGSGQWTMGALSGTSSWAVDSGYATSGQGMLYGDDFNLSSDSYARIKTAVTLPGSGTIYLHFNHAYGFENDDWDGGWLEYSTNGSTWTDAVGFFESGQSTDGSINNTWNNPNGGHQAFLGDSHGYVSSRYDVSSLAGQDVQFRFRMSTDSVVYDWGWFVDDVRIYVCAAAADVPAPQTPTGTITIAEPDFTWNEGSFGFTYFQVNIEDDQGTELYEDWHQNINGLCTAGTCSFDPGLILPNGDYKWQVQAYSTAFPNLTYSAFENFTVNVPPPTLISPIASGNPHGTTPTFSWDDIASETWYQLYVWDSGLTPVINGTWHEASVVCAAGTCTVDPGLTFAEDSYTWDIVPYTSIQTYADASFVVSLGPPEMAVDYNFIEIVDGDTTPSAADGTDFGSVDTGSGAVTHTFDIVNHAAGALSLTGSPIVDISGCGDFSVSSQPASTTVFANVPFELTYDPSSTGACTATVSIDNDDSDENPYTFDVTGTGTVAPEISVKYDANDTEVADGDSTPDTADGTDFGGVDINSGAAYHTFNIVNNGSAVLNLTGTPDVTISGCAALSISSQPASSTVAAGGNSVQFELSFDPSSTGACTATISIDNNDPNEHPYTFDVTGTGTDVPSLVTPANNLTITISDPTFEWVETPGASWYRLEVNGTGGNVIDDWYELGMDFNCPASTCSMPTPSALANDDYTWTVQPYSSGAGYGSNYAAFNFEVAVPLPDLLSPADSSTITDDNTPQYQWEEATGATWYHMLVDGSGGNVIDEWLQVGSGVSCAAGTCSVTPSTALLNDSYTWYVVPWNGSDGPAYTSFGFTINLPLPVLVAPADSSTITATSTPQYQWEETNGATWYQLQVDGTGGNVIDKWYEVGAGVACTAGTCSVTPSTALPNDDYTWSVQSYSSAEGNGGFYASFGFTMNTPPPPMPELLAPADSSTITDDNTPEYQWEEATGASWYHMIVDSSGGNVIDQWLQVGSGVTCTAGTCSVTPVTTLANDSYTWYVIPWDGSDGPAYTTFSFTINLPLPALLTPADSSTITNTNTPQYQWEEATGASWYHLLVDGTGGNVVDEWFQVGSGVTCAAGTCSVTPSNELDNDDYTWYVIPWDGSDGTAYAGFGFTINVPVPALLAPADSSTIFNTTPQYQWEETAGTTWYLLQVDGTGGNVISVWLELGVDVICNAGTCSVTPTTSLPNDDYTWTVQSWSAGAGYGAFYTTFSFTLAPSP